MNVKIQENNFFSKLYNPSYQILTRICYTFTAPLQESLPTFSLVFSICQERLQKTQNQEALYIEARKQTIYIAIFTALPLIIAASLAVGMFYINKQVMYYVDMLYKSFLDLGLHELLQDMVWSNFANYSLLYLTASVLNEFVGQVNAFIVKVCFTQAGSYLTNMWSIDVTEDNLQGLCNIKDAGEHRVVHHTSENMVRMMQLSGKMTAEYSDLVIKFVIAFINFQEINMALLGSVICFSLFANLVSDALVRWKEKIKKQRYEFDAATKKTFDKTGSNPYELATEQKTQGFADKMILALGAQNKILWKQNVIEGICKIWEKCSSAVQWLLTFFCSGAMIYQTNIPYERKADVVFSFDAANGILNSRLTNSDDITNLRWYRGQVEKVTKEKSRNFIRKNFTISYIEEKKIVIENLKITVKNKGKEEELITVKNKSKETELWNIQHYEFVSGTVYMLEAQNSAGKSTLLKAISGHCSKDVQIEGSIQKCKGKWMYLPADPILYEESGVADIDQNSSTVYGNITFGLSSEEISNSIGSLKAALKDNHEVRGIEEMEEQDFILYLLHMLGFEAVFKDTTSLGMQAAVLSGGAKKVITFIRTLLVSPDVLFIDETFNALAANNKIKALSLLKSLFEKCITIIVDHDSTVRQYLETHGSLIILAPSEDKNITERVTRKSFLSL